LNEQLEHGKQYNKYWLFEDIFFPRAVFKAEIVALSESIGGTRKFRNKHSKRNGSLKALLQE
jgi:hypothetical protein